MVPEDVTVVTACQQSPVTVRNSILSISLYVRLDSLLFTLNAALQAVLLCTLSMDESKRRLFHDTDNYQRTFPAL